MRCLCCDVILTDQEATKKDDFGQPIDWCDACELESDIHMRIQSDPLDTLTYGWEEWPTDDEDDESDGS